MTQDIFIGIDGGGTKTTARIENMHGDVLAEAAGGPANVRISVERAWQSIEATLAIALQLAGLRLDDKAYRFHAGMGLAGLEVAAAGEAFLARSHSFATLKLCTDAHTACLGAHLGGDGAIIIVGTGVVGYQIQSGKTNKVGGWGFPNDDEGSGAWMGLEAVRHTFKWIDGRNEVSHLAKSVFDFFQNSVEKLSNWINTADSTQYATLAPLVIEQAKQGDVAAVIILQKAAQAVDEVACTLEKLQQQREPLLPCALVGGIAPFVAPYLSERQRARLVPCQKNPNVGAILLVKDYVKTQ
ncbi:hypothetical protein AYO45_02330 [Gammaproteobacteria bacterium SCGC AG-212-F23]|nr:hypothetical protein AYO45_02330 [Gammaproteobacteria bacterium SCGC AG-212-F23]